MTAPDDTEAATMPDMPQRRPPIHLVRIAPTDTLREVATKQADAIGAIEYRANELNEAVADVQIGLLANERATRGNGARIDALVTVTGELRRELRAVAVKVGAIEAGAELPPMRERTTSSAEFVERVSERMVNELRQVAAKTPGPQVQATPEELAKLLETRLAEELAKREHAAEMKRLAEFDAGVAAAKALREKRAEERRSDVRKVIVGAVLAAVVAVGGMVFTYTRGHVAGLSERTTQGESR